MKIIGYTVGTTLPKPSLAQNDPTKGDYIKDKEILDEKYIKVDEQELTDEQKAQVRTNVDAVSMTEAEALTDSVAFIDAEDNENVENPDIEIASIVVDSILSTSSTNPVQNRVITQEINTLSETIASLQLDELEIIEMLTECEIIEPAIDNTGAFYVENENIIYVL